MELDCSVLFKISLLCLGLQARFVDIRAIPISNYGGYRPHNYYIEARVIREPRGSGSQWPMEQDNSSDKVHGGQMSFSRDYGIYMRDEIRAPSDSNIVFPETPLPQPRRVYSRRPMSTPTRNTPGLWTSELGQITEDGKPLKPESKLVHPQSIPPTRSPDQSNQGEKEDLGDLLGDFYTWMGSNDKSKEPSKEEGQRISNEKPSQEMSTLSKRKKFDPLGDEDIATKTNFVGGNEEKIEEDNLDGMDVTEQSLLNALNDKPCPSGYKRVPSGECKPKIKV